MACHVAIHEGCVCVCVCVWGGGGGDGTSINIPPLQNRDNPFAFTDYEKAEELISYFASISTVDDVNTGILKFENHLNVKFK